MADTFGRPILPQASFAWQPPVTEKMPKQTNYVFVDEHNRSRRLKVMRACENCRKRKIKCDAATTNVWPCGACLKQRLSCAPPVLNLEKGEIPELTPRETPAKRDEYRKTPETKVEQLSSKFQSISPAASAPPASYQPQMAKREPRSSSESDALKPPTETYQGDSHPQSFHETPPATHSSPPAAHSIYEQSHPLSPARSASAWPETPDTDLTETMKELNIDSVGMAVYINKKSLADKAAVFDVEPTIPIPADPGGRVRIPDNMMPDEDEAQVYFKYFFDNVHQYIPVLNRASFMDQWTIDKQSISPLILESIFAITTQLLNQDTSLSNKWLDLASQHEKAFDDVSRLSTVQGLLLLLKARESVPRRGYYWRSWMQISKIIMMAKDLELSQHLELHQMGQSCDSRSRGECHAKIRTWQTCFVVELMIGGPQGRQFQIAVESVDFEFPDNLKNIFEDAEETVSRQFTNLAKAIRNVRSTIARYAVLRKEKPDWALDERYQIVNRSYDAWLRDLPDNAQIYFPQDSSTPQISSHFIANMHSYYYLSIVMHHRPQLEAAQSKGPDMFMNQLIICYTAATRLCRLQEAIMESFGLNGLLWMPRGVNFSIYAILTSTMLHLVALTCPDPALNYDAMDYFPRHMRILERCVVNWPMPEMQAQVRSLQEAFSADPSKPFELRSDFPRAESISRGSPRSDTDLSQSQPYVSIEQPSHPTHQQQISMQQAGVFSQERRPPDLESSALQAQGTLDFGYGHDTSSYASQPSQSYAHWDPSRISALWTTAFEPPPGAYDQGSPSSQQQSTPPPNQPQFTQNVTNVTNVQYNTYTNGSFAATAYPDNIAQAAQWPQYQQPQMQTQINPNQQPSIHQQINQAAPTFHNPFMAQASITPGMWQDAVASSYGLGSKRHFSDASETHVPAQKRAR